MVRNKTLLGILGIACFSYQVFSKEFIINENRFLRPDPNVEERPFVASGKNSYLAVWDFARATPMNEYGEPEEIHGTRISLNGEILDTGGIVISFGPGFRYSPTASFDGENYLVVWVDVGEGYPDREYHISGARVTESGEVLDPKPIPISVSVLGTQNVPALAFDGVNYLIVWRNHHNREYDIFGARVSPSGEVLDPEGIPISTANNTQDLPSVAFDGEKYFVVWTDFRNKNWDIYGARVSPTGEVLDPKGIPIYTGYGNQGDACVAFDGKNYLVVWEGDERGNCDVYACRVSPSGIVLDSTPIPLSLESVDQIHTSVSFNGEDYLICWTDWIASGSVGGVRVSPSGVLLDSAPIIISKGDWRYTREPKYASIASNGGRWLAVWEVLHPHIIYDISAVFINPDGSLVDSAKNISTVANIQQAPALGFDGENYLVVWWDERDSTSQGIYGARITPSGKILDSDAILISKGGGMPALAFNGTQYLVVWNRGHSFFGSRVLPSGEVLDTGGIFIDYVGANSYWNSSSIASDGENYLVVWGYGGGIGGALISPEGEKIKSLSLYLPGYPEPSSVIFDGENYFVAWKHKETSIKSLHCCWISRKGEILDTVSFSYPFLETERPLLNISKDQGRRNLSIAFDGKNYFVVCDFVVGGLMDIYGALINSEGELLKWVEMPHSQDAFQGYCSVCFDGENYLVVWEKWEKDDNHCMGRRWDVYGTKISPSGEVLETFPIDIGKGVWKNIRYQATPVVAHEPGDQCFIVWSRFTPSYGTNRIWGTFYPREGIKERVIEKKVSKNRLEIIPNPGREGVSVNYQISKKGSISLKVYDATGRVLKTLAILQNQEPGVYSIKWDIRGEKLPNGIYFFKLNTPNSSIIQKIVVLK